MIQLEARTENEKMAFFSKQKSERIVKTILELFCEEKMPYFHSNSALQLNHSG